MAAATEQEARSWGNGETWSIQGDVTTAQCHRSRDNHGVTGDLIIRPGGVVPWTGLRTSAFVVAGWVSPSSCLHKGCDPRAWTADIFKVLFNVLSCPVAPSVSLWLELRQTRRRTGISNCPSMYWALTEHLLSAMAWMCFVPKGMAL